MSDLFYKMQAEVLAATTQPPPGKTQRQPIEATDIVGYEIWAWHKWNLYWSRRYRGRASGGSDIYLSLQDAEKDATRISSVWSDVHIVAIKLGPLTTEKTGNQP